MLYYEFLETVIITYLFVLLSYFMNGRRKLPLCGINPLNWQSLTHVVQDFGAIVAKTLEGAIGRREQCQGSIFEGRLGRFVRHQQRVELQMERG